MFLVISYILTSMGLFLSGSLAIKELAIEAKEKATLIFLLFVLILLLSYPLLGLR
ncbi:hypothetical protein [Rufibacter psychrotolerans]|uniref:hypothetical protein n=1 Tax=Rufibacter psychrotolerans TaxID=2812556 RepID=UPI0019682419|nr:hypothetical protein [Rufibacter sp. SYSU D00308]